MTRSSPGQLSFAAGELSPLLAGRADYQRYQSGLSQCRGFLPLRQGGITRAPGTWYRGRTRLDARARLIDFEFAANDAVVLEFTPLAMRVWRYGELVLNDVTGEPYVLVTPYDGAALDRLQWVQSADVIYIADGALPIQKLSRFSLDSWAIAPVEFTNGPFRLENQTKTVTIAASAATGTISLTGVGNPFSADLIGSLIRLQAVDMDTVALWTGNQAATVGDKVRYDGNIYELVAGTNTGVNPPIHLEGDHKYDEVAGTVWRFLSDGIGIVRITAVANPNSATATVIRAVPAPLVATPTYRWSLGAWSERHGYPAAIEIHEQRLVAAATPSDPRTIWFSTAGLLEDFEPSIEADGSFAYSIGGRQSVNRIVWLASGRRGLHIGALGETYSTRSTGAAQAIGPTTAILVLDTDHGCAKIRPILPDGKPIFVNRDGQRLIELAYAFESDSNEARELSLPSEHLGHGGFAEIVWQSSPLRLAWVRRNAGDLAVMVYDPSEDVLGWAVYTVADGGIVESIAVTPAADGARDVLTLSVARFIDGVLVRTIEEQAAIFGIAGEDVPPHSACHLFAATAHTSNPAINSFAVPHLVGSGVLVWTEQGQFGPYVVPPSGEVTLDQPVTNAIIGLWDDGQVAETLDIVAPARDGISIGRKKRLHKGTGVIVHRTAGGTIRSHAADLGRPPVQERPEQIVPRHVADDAVSIVSGVSRVDVLSVPATRVTLLIEPEGAKPLTVLALVPRIEEFG